MSESLRPADDGARSPGAAPGVRSRRALPRFRWATQLHGARRWTPKSTRLAARARRRSACHTATASRPCSRTAPSRWSRFFAALQARRGAGADQHRVQGRVPAPPARRLGREDLHRAGRLRVRAAEVVGADSTPGLTHCVMVDPPDAVIDAVPAIRWADTLGARRRRADRRVARFARATSRASSTPRARPARARAACSRRTTS